jgi:hypothetical protein
MGQGDNGTIIGLKMIQALLTGDGYFHPIVSGLTYSRTTEN